MSMIMEDDEYTTDDLDHILHAERHDTDFSKNRNQHSVESKDSAIQQPIQTERAYSIVFDVDGCAVSFMLAFLADQSCSQYVYIITYCEDTPFHTTDTPYIRELDTAPNVSNSAPTRVTFYLLNQMPSNLGGGYRKDRVRAAFVCDFPKYSHDAKLLFKALNHGDPLSTCLLKRTLNEDATFALHDHFTTILSITLKGVVPKSVTGCVTGNSETAMMSIAEAFPRGRRGLLLLYIKHQQKLISAYRRLYGGTSTTTFWYVSKFGPSEKSLVLCTRYYLLQYKHNHQCIDYDLQAIKDICLTYEVPVMTNSSELRIQDITSFAKLSKFCCCSGYSSKDTVEWFPNYVWDRISADITEVDALKGFIERDRDGLRISDGEFIKYMYVAHFECYNRKQIYRHLQSVTVTTIGEVVSGRSNLGACAVEGFFTYVRSQLNIGHYVATNVSPQITDLKTSNLASAFAHAKFYSNTSMNRSSNEPIHIWGYSTQIAKRLDSVEHVLSKHGWPQTPSSESFSSTSSGTEYPENNYDHFCTTWSRQSTEDNYTSINSSEKSFVQSSPMIVRRLLALSSADGLPQLTTPAAIFMGVHSVSGPIPVYRSSALRNKQLFGMTAVDCWSKCISAPTKEVIQCAWEKIQHHSDYISCSDEALDAALTSVLYNHNVTPTFSNTFLPTNAGKRKFSHDLYDKETVLPVCSLDTTDMVRIYLNRHEIFNANLAIGNIILDIDMKLKRVVPYIILHSALRGFRKGIISALKVLFPKGYNENASLWDSHPIYFYKTECMSQSNNKTHIRMSDSMEEDVDNYLLVPPENESTLTDEGWEEAYTSLIFEPTNETHTTVCDNTQTHLDISPESERVSGTNFSNKSALACITDTFKLECVCAEKIGLRVCIPVPSPYAIHGSSTITGLSRIIQQAVLLEREFVESIGDYLRDYDIVDYCVYGHCRSLRMPFFGKPKPDGSCSGKLLPLYVIPKPRSDPTEFVLQHFFPHTFHAHALIPGSSYPTLIMHELQGNFTSFFDRKTATNRAIYFGPRMCLLTELTKRGVNVKDPASIEAFAAEAILSDIETYVRTHFSDRAAEYKYIATRCSSIKEDWILLQIIPTGTGRFRTFTCIRYKHTRPSGNSVRTYLSLTIDAHGRLCASVGQRCFAAKCENNKLRTLFTIDVK